MKTEIPFCSVARLDADRRNQTRYELLCLRVEGLTVYAVYIRGTEDDALELLGRDADLAKEAFRQIAQGELSPLHLYDWASDWRAETEKTLF